MTKRPADGVPVDESPEPSPKRPAPELPTLAGIWASMSNWFVQGWIDTWNALFPPKDGQR